MSLFYVKQQRVLLKRCLGVLGTDVPVRLGNISWGATGVKSNLFNLSSTVTLWIENLSKLGKANVEFLVLMLTQTQLDLTLHNLS